MNGVNMHLLSDGSSIFETFPTNDRCAIDPTERVTATGGVQPISVLVERIDDTTRRSLIRDVVGL